MPTEIGMGNHRFQQARNARRYQRGKTMRSLLFIFGVLAFTLSELFAQCDPYNSGGTEFGSPIVRMLRFVSILMPQAVHGGSGGRRRARARLSSGSTETETVALMIGPSSTAPPQDC